MHALKMEQGAKFPKTEEIPEFTAVRKPHYCKKKKISIALDTFPITPSPHHASVTPVYLNRSTQKVYKN
jgi:hypothetical protein